MCTRWLSVATALASPAAAFLRALHILLLEAVCQGVLSSIMPHLRAAAGQMILEELLLGDVHLHPYELLGWEGLFGTIFMLGVSLPIVGMIPGAGCCSSVALRACV